MDTIIQAGLTSAIDLMPTVLDITGQSIPEWVKGKSLLPSVKNTDLKGHDYVVSGATFPAQEKHSRDITVTTDEWSLLFYPERGGSWLFNLKQDPGQKKNVIDRCPDVAKKLHQHLLKFMSDNHVPEQFQATRRKLLF